MKFHINKKGVPAACSATVKQCPYGGAGSHYESENDALLVCKIQNELNHGLIHSEQQKVKEAKTEEDFQYIEIRKKSLVNSAKEANKISHVERISSAVLIENFNPKKIESHHFKVEREKRNGIIKEIGMGERIADFECKVKVGGKDVEQTYRIYDSGYVEIYKKNVKDKTGKSQFLVTAYIFTKNQMEAVFLKGGHTVSSEWLDEVYKNNKKMKQNLSNKSDSSDKREDSNSKEDKNPSNNKSKKEISNHVKSAESQKNSAQKTQNSSPEEQAKRKKKASDRRRRQRENARKRKSELFSKEQIENEKINSMC